MRTAAAIDRLRARAFAGRMAHLVDQGLLALLTSLGHQLGLFDTLARLPAATPGEIAAAAGVDEAYLAGWLAAMVSGGIVDHDGARGTYRLPGEHAEALTGAGSAAAAARELAVLAAAEPAMLACLGARAPVPATALAALDALVGESPGDGADLLADQVLPLVTGLPARLRAGLDVLDPGGRTTAALRRRFPASRFAARPSPAGHDLVLLLDHAPRLTSRRLADAHAALRAGGVILVAGAAAASTLADNLDHPRGPALYAWSGIHGLAAARAGDGGDRLWGDERLRRALTAAGFDAIAAHRLAGDPVHIYYAARRA